MKKKPTNKEILQFKLSYTEAASEATRLLHQYRDLVVEEMILFGGFTNPIDMHSFALQAVARRLMDLSNETEVTRQAYDIINDL